MGLHCVDVLRGNQTINALLIETHSLEAHLVGSNFFNGRLLVLIVITTRGGIAYLAIPFKLLFSLKALDTLTYISNIPNTL